MHFQLFNGKNEKSTINKTVKIVTQILYIPHLLADFTKGFTLFLRQYNPNFGVNV